MSHAGSYRYRVVDVFTSKALEGNPLAVFPEAEGLDDETMQKLARELNLSETTFILPATRSDCVANVRIFTPTREMIFAGHPTIGTSWVLLDEGVVPKDHLNFALEEKVGAVPIRVEPGDPPMIWLTTPPISFRETFSRDVCAAALGVSTTDLLELMPQIVTAGNPVLYIPVKDRDAVDRSGVDLAGVRQIFGSDHKEICVFVFTPTPEGAYSRMFAPELGVVEDPATGSATGPLAAYMIEHGLVPSSAGTRFVSEQGVKMGRRSLLHVQLNGERGVDGIDVGGNVAPFADAVLRM
jgi:trans-2,3-dihydro-3-hydroxyanthranilate isomerase